MRIVWECKNTGAVAATDTYEVPASTSMQEALLHDWIPVTLKEDLQ